VVGSATDPFVRTSRSRERSKGAARSHSEVWCEDKRSPCWTQGRPFRRVLPGTLHAMIGRSGTHPSRMFA